MFFIHLLMILSAILVSTSFTVGAAIAHGMNPSLLTFFRFLLAAVLMAPLVYHQYGFRVSLKDLLRYSTISASLVFFFWCMFLSLRYTTALNTSVIFTLVPSISGFYAFILIGERLGRPKLLALACGLAGAAWVIFRGDLSQFLNMNWNRGDLIFLLGCFSMAFYTPLVHLLHRGESMVKMTFWVLVTGCGWLFVLTANQLVQLSYGDISLHVWGGIIYLAIFSTIVTFFLTQFATIRLGSTVVMSYSYLYPPFVVVIELFLGHGLPDMKTWPGVLMILLAMIVILKGEKSPQQNQLKP